MSEGLLPLTETPVPRASVNARFLCVIFLATSIGTLCAEAQGPALTPSARREDVAQLRDLLLRVEHSWTDATRALAVARLDTLDRAADTISAVGFELAIARIVATSDNGHSGVAATRRANRFNRIGFRLTPFEGDFVVMRARPELAELLGARLVAVDGRPLEEVRAIGRTLHGGTPAWRDRSVPFFLESPEQMQALGASRTGDAATYRFVTLTGTTIERRITAEPADSTRARMASQRWLFGDPVPTDASEWRVLRPSTALPWSIQEPITAFRLRHAREIDAVVVELRQNTNAPNAPIAAFLDSARRMIEQLKPRHVVLDMRLNGGGDLNRTRDFMKALPTLVPGRVFALTSPYTFSAAISSVGYLKQAAPDRVTIVGEEVGDRLVFFAEGSPTELKNVKVFVGTATERHDYQNGCRAFTDCHGPVVRNPIAVPTLVPEIWAPWTLASYLAGKDPAMEAVAARVAQERGR